MKRFKCQTENFILADKKPKDKKPSDKKPSDKKPSDKKPKDKKPSDKKPSVKRPKDKKPSDKKPKDKKPSDKKPKDKSKSKYEPEIERFRDAYQYGISANDIKKRGEDSFQFHVKGVSWRAAHHEIIFKKQKKLHYMWYIFPQPKPNIKKLSQTSQYFHILDEEVILFLHNKYLLEHLSYAVKSLVIYHNDNTQTLKKFFERNGDDIKFSSFRRKFLEILRKIDRKKNEELENLYNNLKLLKMPYDKK